MGIPSAITKATRWSSHRGIKPGPFAMVDWFGTPQTPALHVVERLPPAGLMTSQKKHWSGAEEENALTHP